MGLVLFILLLMAGIAIPMTSGLFSEERLRGHLRELQKYARTARRLAVSENRPYEILFMKNSFLIEPCLAADDQNGDTVVEHHVPKDVDYTLKRWGAKAFEKPGDQTWIFQPGGICEPIRIRFESGKGWVECSFHPLTAAAEDETYSFQ
jgi:hypothetical protein